MKVSFRIKGTADKPVSIYMRVNGKELNTGYKVHPRYWNAKKQRCISRSDPILKNLNSALDKLQYETSTGDTRLDRKTVIGALQEMIEHTYANEWKPGTKKNYSTFMRLLIKYGEIKYPEHLDKKAVDDFLSWMIDEMDYSDTYVARTLKKLKMICKEMQSLEYKVHPYVLNARPVKRHSERITITFKPEDIKIIKATEMPSEGLENARLLILLGLNVGCRVSDLMRLTRANLRTVGDVTLVDYRAIKTGKVSTVPITDKEVLDMLLERWPKPISDQKFNKHLKEVIRRCGLDRPTLGYLTIDGRSKLVEAPFYKFCRSHMLRKSFCQIAYDLGLDIHLIMEMTQHSSEAVFRLYIGRKRDKDKDALDFYKSMKQKLPQ